MKEQIHEEPKVLAAAERQMQAWAMNSQIADQSINRRIHLSHARQYKSYLTISREAGAGGSEIAQLVGRRLGWDVFDKNLLDCVAERFQINRHMLDLVDETPSNWVYDMLGTWMDSKVVPHEKYVAHLRGVILAIARRENFVFVGRGAQFILPRAKVAAIRLVASESYRIKRTMQFASINEARAKRLIHEIDNGRREFVQQFFHHDLNDPHIYDLVINTERFGIEGSVEQILSAECLALPVQARPDQVQV